MTGRESLPDSARIGRVALRVDDLPSVIDFYRDVIGLAVLSRGDGRARLGVDGTTLLVLAADADAPERPHASAGLYHTAFRVPSRSALSDALGRIRDGWRLDGASDHGVSEALYLSDPEGNGVEVYRDRPEAEWPMGEGGRVAMDTRPLDLDDLAEAEDVGGRNGGEATCPPGTTVGHVHLEVTSLEAAREFYVDALGLNLRQTYGDAALFVAAGGYHHHVGLNTWNGRSEPAAGRGLAWFEFVVPDADAIESLRRRLDDRGIETGSRSDEVRVSDPDGIAVRVRVSE